MRHVRFMEGWVPIHRMAVLSYLWRGAGRFRRMVGCRSWSIFLVCHDPTGVHAPADRLPTLDEAIAEADERRRSTLGVDG